ncbi:MAG: fused MFS/spermidine synthase [Myxococcota bacterium]
MLRRRWIQGAAAAAAGLACGVPSRPSLAAGETVLEEAHSPYNHIVVTERGTVRTMYFVVDGTYYIESRLDRGYAQSLDLDYTRTMMAAFLVKPDVKRFLMIGFGGGQITNYLFNRFEGIEIDAVDIDPEVIRLARKYFEVPDSPRYRTHAADGRLFVEQAGDQQWDVILLDAFRGVFVPLHLKTAEYYAVLRDHLTPDGVVAANLHSLTEKYPNDRQTFASVFSQRYGFRSENGRQTCFVAGSSPAPVSPYALRANARALQSNFDFDLMGLAARIHLAQDWNPDAAVLHDDFASKDSAAGATKHNANCAGDDCAYSTK